MTLVYLWLLMAVPSYFGWRCLLRPTMGWSRGDRRLFLVVSLVAGPGGLLAGGLVYGLHWLLKAHGGDRPARW